MNVYGKGCAVQIDLYLFMLASSMYEIVLTFRNTIIIGKYSNWILNQE